MNTLMSCLHQRFTGHTLHEFLPIDFMRFYTKFYILSHFLFFSFLLFWKQVKTP